MADSWKGPKMSTLDDKNEISRRRFLEGTSVALVKDLIDAVNRRWISDAQEPVPEVRSVHVYEKIVFIEKA